MIDVYPVATPEQHAIAMRIATAEIFEPAAPDTLEALAQTALELSDAEIAVGLDINTGEVHGMIAYQMNDGANSATIKAVATTSEARVRRLRLGTALVEYAEEAVVLDGAQEIVLEALDGARDFYEKQGYANVGGPYYTKQLG